MECEGFGYKKQTDLQTLQQAQEVSWSARCRRDQGARKRLPGSQQAQEVSWRSK